MIPSGTGFLTTTGTPPSATASTDPEDGGGGGSVNSGAIAGGVVGGVAGVAIIGAAAWWFLRRRRHGAVPLPMDEGAAAGKSEIDSIPASKSPEGPPRELAVHERPGELDANPNANQPPSELPA